jgi:hypothetical protein
VPVDVTAKWVLVVDDDEDTRETVVECLRSEGYLAVKTGILGRSRSAVSGRNRFYQPSDAVRFRALNSLSPRPPCGGCAAANQKERCREMKGFRESNHGRPPREDVHGVRRTLALVPAGVTATVNSLVVAL